MMNRDVLRGSGETSQRASEGMRNDPILEPKHKIFLSHSGAQKEFVEVLCKALEDRLHYPFFDRRPESLPKGERFPELIVQAAEQCKMLVVVVSDEYFMSKWPMIELAAFVKAYKLHHESKSSTNGPKILPLFYDLSVDELGSLTRREKWFQEWETLAKGDPRIGVSDWKSALDFLRSFNGLPYDKALKEFMAYIDKIVLHVCNTIPPDLEFDDSHVQGKSSICKVIGEKIEGIGVSKIYNVKVVGLHGVGGIGKTTTCMTLCNELSSKYEGRVCHIEYPIDPPSDSKEFFQKVVRDLIRPSSQAIRDLNNYQCKDILRKSLSKQRTFLAIDNVFDNHQSIELAKMLLELPYHMDSLVVVTARSPSVLKLLGLDGDACLEMPDLGEANAMKLFLQHAANGKEFFEDEEKHEIMTCVKRCHFSKGSGQGHHYHPLALKALGIQLSCHGENPSLWVENLPCVWTFNSFLGGNPVFDILRSGFNQLPRRDQTLFIDLGHFFDGRWGFKKFDLEWLCIAHRQDEKAISQRLEKLKQKGLVQDVDLVSGKISMHDLYKEFVKLEAEGSFNESTSLRKRMWIHVNNGDLTELERKPKGGFWDMMIRLTIKQKQPDWYLERRGQKCVIVNLVDIQWDHFSNLEVLHLHGLHWGCGVVNFKDLMCLRILDVEDVMDVTRIEGLKKLKHLTYFKFKALLSRFRFGTRVQSFDQLPSSLKRLEIRGVNVELGDLLAQCHDLSKLELHDVEDCSLDLSNCRSLKSVSLWNMLKLQTLDLSNCRSLETLFLEGMKDLHTLELRNCGSLESLNLDENRNLQKLSKLRQSSSISLIISNCKDLDHILGLDHLIGLKKLSIERCDKYKFPSVFALPNLQVLSLGNQGMHWWLSSEGLNLNGCNQLEVLDLRFSHGLTSLAELGDLPALRHLNLFECIHLLRLPHLSKSKNLKELDLDGCYALELYDDDIDMFSELPLLQPLPFRVLGMGDVLLRLDLHRLKLLVYSNCVGCALSGEPLEGEEWMEQDLVGPLPIKIREFYPVDKWMEPH